jgi:ABC-type antimicrobial peptide transport system permease subunit
LRALGFTKVRLVLLYTYESFILVLASSLLGVIVGTLAAFTMVLQFTTFVGMPTIFYFPGWQVLYISLIAFLCALMSAIGPTQQIVRQRIASILKSA